MENASKALIIAGAILISILLISVGIMVMNSISGVQTNAEGQMDAMAIQTFNSKIQQYVGTNRRGSLVKGLYDVVLSQNNAFKDNPVAINGTSDNIGLADAQAAIASTGRFSIKVTQMDEQGLITEITITPEGSSTGGTGGSTVTP